MELEKKHRANSEIPLHYAAQQDKSQTAFKGKGINSGLDEKAKEWREVLKMV